MKYCLVLLGFLWLLGVVLADDLVIEREVVVEPLKWKEIEGTELFEGRFWVGSDFLSRLRGENDPEDPFDGSSKVAQKDEIKKSLESVGIPFPEGGTVVFVPQSSEVIVRNTWANLELVEVYLTPGFVSPFPRMISVRTEIYEVSILQALQLQESSEGKLGHKPERDAVLKGVRAGSAKLVASHSVVATAGQRMELRDMVELGVGFVGSDGKRGAEEGLPKHGHGTVLTVEPNVSGEMTVISLRISLEHHTADPELVKVEELGEVPRFHAKSVVTNVDLPVGGYLLLASWKPTGKAAYAEGDVMQVVFVTASLQGAP